MATAANFTHSSSTPPRAYASKNTSKKRGVAPGTYRSVLISYRSVGYDFMIISYSPRVTTRCGDSCNMPHSLVRHMHLRRPHHTNHETTIPSSRQALRK